jgi:hypothetical protein
MYNSFKMFGENHVEFDLNATGEIGFYVNGEDIRFLPENKRYPHICRWILKQFLSIKDLYPCVWCAVTVKGSDRDSKTREKVYNKVFDNKFTITSNDCDFIIYYSGDLETLNKFLVESY